MILCDFQCTGFKWINRYSRFQKLPTYSNCYSEHPQMFCDGAKAELTKVRHQHSETKEPHSQELV